MLWLIFAHFIGDWGLQSDWLSQNKSKYWFVMLAHCMIWTACICIALEYIENLQWWHPYFLCLGHFICDKWKCNSTIYFPTWHFYLDQCWHLIQCLIVSIKLN